MAALGWSPEASSSSVRHRLRDMTDIVLLPGIIAPAEVRYAPLLEHLDGVNAIIKNLEVYAADQPPRDYSIATEISGIETAADRAGLGRFHICSHSGGAACALAYATAHPERVISLAVDEPATDFTDEDRADPYWDQIAAAEALEGPETVVAFLRLQVAPGVELPAPPNGPPPPWMAKRPAGIRALAGALRQHRVESSSYEAVHVPVLYTYGTLTHPRWLAMRDRLARLFADFRSEAFEGLHHLNTSHQAEPARTAALLRELWARAETG
jgi:pimeloyl-ACP methyl ester carboxylesterase